MGNLSQEFLVNEMRLLVEMLDPGAFEFDIYENLTLLQDVFDANNYSVLQVMNMVYRHIQ